MGFHYWCLLGLLCGRANCIDIGWGVVVCWLFGVFTVHAF